MNINKNYTATASMVISSIFAGTTFFVIKNLVSTVDPVMITAYRFLGAGFILLILTILQRKSILKHSRSGIVLGLFLFIFFLGQNIGLEYTTAAKSSFLTGMFVVLVPFISFFIERERITITHLITVSLSGLGLWIISGGLSSFNYGDGLSIVAALVYALFIVVGDKFIRKNDYDILTLTMQQFIVTGFLSLCWVLLFSQNFGYDSTTSLMQLLYLIIFPTLISFGVINWTQEILPAFRVSMLMTLTTVFGVAMAWTFGGESYAAADIFGGTILCIAIFLSSWKRAS